MAKCERCEIDYPDELVNKLSSWRGSIELCGICALKLTNEIHGLKRTKFDGQKAERLRQEAIMWRRKHVTQ